MCTFPMGRGMVLSMGRFKEGDLVRCCACEFLHDVNVGDVGIYISSDECRVCKNKIYMISCQAMIYMYDHEFEHLVRDHE